MWNKSIFDIFKISYLKPSSVQYNDLSNDLFNNLFSDSDLSTFSIDFTTPNQVNNTILFKGFNNIVNTLPLFYKNIQSLYKNFKLYPNAQNYSYGYTNNLGISYYTKYCQQVVSDIFNSILLPNNLDYLFIYQSSNKKIRNFNPVLYFNYLDNLEPEFEPELDLPDIKLLITSERQNIFSKI